MSRIADWWAKMSNGEKELVAGGFLFSKVVYLWMVFLFLWLTPLFGDVVGLESLTSRRVFEATLINNFFYLLNYSPHLWRAVLAIHVISALLCIVNLGHGKLALSSRFWVLNVGLEMVCKVVAWTSGIMLISSTFLLYTAGIYLAGSWLFFLVFYFPRAKESWKVVFNNWSILACRVQFLVVYFYSALYKWLDTDWLNGDSVHFLSLSKSFTPEWLSAFYQSVPWLTTSITYFILIYLTVFPVLIWWKKAKNFLLVVGIGFHLYTMFVMKLYDFGSIMIVGYFLFLSKEHVDFLKKYVRISKLKSMVTQS